MDTNDIQRVNSHLPYSVYIHSSLLKSMGAFPERGLNGHAQFDLLIPAVMQDTALKRKVALLNPSGTMTAYSESCPSNRKGASNVKVLS